MRMHELWDSLCRTAQFFDCSFGQLKCHPRLSRLHQVGARGQLVGRDKPIPWVEGWDTQYENSIRANRPEVFYTVLHDFIPDATSLILGQDATRGE